jgi:hypothetical protein
VPSEAAKVLGSMLDSGLFSFFILLV